MRKPIKCGAGFLNDSEGRPFVLSRNRAEVVGRKILDAQRDLWDSKYRCLMRVTITGSVSVERNETKS